MGLIHAGTRPPRTANSSVTRQPQVRVSRPAAIAASRTASASPPSAATSAARIATSPWPSAAVSESCVRIFARVRAREAAVSALWNVPVTRAIRPT